MSFSKGNLIGTSDFGSVVLGPTSFSLGQLLRILKLICSGNNSEMVITGSLQKYGNVMILVAIMEQKGTKAWEVRRSIKANNDIEYEYIYGMISDLAYKIFFDQRKKSISAKTWSELKYITPALDSYQQYNLTGDIKILEKSHNECIRAASVNPGYEKPIKLLYNIAIAYWEKDKSYEAEKLFRQIVILEPDNINAWEGWGIALRFFHLDKAAIKCFETVLDKNPKPAQEAEIYCMKAISHRNLDQPDKSISCLEKSLELNKKYGLAYQYLGQVHMLEGRINEAIKAFEDCEKYDKNLKLIHPSLARLYEAQQNYPKQVEHCKKAKKYLKDRTLYDRACYQAICENNKKEVLELLKIVCKKKQVAKTWIHKDPELENIRNHPELGPKFMECLGEYDDTKEIDQSILLSELLSKIAIYQKLGLDLENKDEMFKNIRSKVEDREYDCARYYAICTLVIC
jgi:tetratricopeptide (TPR) repeat protein